MDQPIRLIRAEPADLPRVLALARSAIAAIRPGAYSETELARWHRHPAAGLEALLASGRYRLAAVGPALVGCGGWQPGEAGSGVMRAVYVLPQAQGAGVGARLIDAAEAGMRAEAMALSRIPAALSAERFYARLGYESGARGQAETPDGPVPFVWMARSLAALRVAA